MRICEIEDYVVLRSDEELEAQTKFFLERGYEVYGVPFILGNIFIQAVIKYKDQNA